MDNRMIVVYAASRNLYPWLPMAYMSLLEHNPDAKVWMLIEDDRLPYDVPENIECVNVSKQNLFGPDGANWRTEYSYLSLMRSTYAKLFTGKPNGCGIRTLPKLDKILQLDCDVIVRESLRVLWDVEMDGKWFFMADEVLSNYRPLGKTEPHYFNCGVCLFNLEQMRKDDIVDEGIKWLNETKMRCIDQDLWNWLLKKYGYDKCLIMGSRYNETFVTGESLRPAIVHACGEKRWWENHDEMYRGAYWKPYEKYCQWQACRDVGIKC